MPYQLNQTLSTGQERTMSSRGCNRYLKLLLLRSTDFLLGLTD
jgi:hypothetical protein